MPPNSPDRSESPFKNELFQNRRQKEQGPNGDLFESFQCNAVCGSLKPNLSSATPEPSKNPPNQLARFLLNMFSHEWKRKVFQGHLIPTIT